jgi:hypothetical protein
MEMESFEGIPNDRNPLNQTIFVERNPKDSNVIIFLHNFFKSKSLIKLKA